MKEIIGKILKYNVIFVTSVFVAIFGAGLIGFLISIFSGDNFDTELGPLFISLKIIEIPNPLLILIAIFWAALVYQGIKFIISEIKSKW